MKLDDRLKRVAVLGAAGKMGSGIAFLALQEMARCELEGTRKIGSGEYRLYLIDINEEALFNLKTMLKQQIKRHAEKSINYLRECYAKNPDLISNEEIVNDFVEGAIGMIRLEDSVSQASHAHMIFEAIIEDPKLKTKVLSSLAAAAPKDALFLSNTSSIPIQPLAKETGLTGRLIGFHFYNPPPVQKLLEIIPAEDSEPELVAQANEVAKRMGKIIVISKDVAGFIGNGHFLREIEGTLQDVKRLRAEGYSDVEAIEMMNRVTQDFLLRPMGMFQLLDYVGVDVCRKIMDILHEHLGLVFNKDMLEGVTTFYKMEGSKPVGIYSVEKGEYLPIPEVDLGPLPEGHIPWRKLHRMKEREEVLKTYFSSLFEQKTLGCKLAQDFLIRSRQIGEGLVTDGVAESISDVNTVLMNGFYHVYGLDAIPERSRS